jgi:hypothetical protein
MTLEALGKFKQFQQHLETEEKLTAEKAKHIYEMVADILQGCNYSDDDGFLSIPLPVETEGKRPASSSVNRIVIVKVQGIKGDELSGNEGKQKQALKDHKATISITGLIDACLEEQIRRLRLMMPPRDNLRSVLTISSDEDGVFTALITPKELKKLGPSYPYYPGAGTTRAPLYEEMRDFEAVIQGYYGFLTRNVNSDSA